MTTATQRRRVYPARRAVENAAAIPDVRPLRLFPLVWPLWQVETAASVYDEQDYDVIDRFLVRAVAEAGFADAASLSSFFGIPATLTQRCLAFLAAIGHVHHDDETGAVRLTELGLRSARDGVRHEPKESRQDIYIDRFTARPLPRRYYEGSVPIFTTHKVPEDALYDRSRFTPLLAWTPFREEIVLGLAARGDRAEFNLPAQLRDLRVIQHGEAFLPTYLIETADSGLFVYTARAAERDAFFEEACRQLPAIHHMIDAEEMTDPREFWTAWLADSNVGRGILHRLPNGVWRATLRSDAFGPAGRLRLSQLGSFELRKRYFLQLWSDDAGQRRQAVMDRALAMTQSPDVITKMDLCERVTTLSRQLEVPEPSLTDIREYGEEHDMHIRLARLDALE
jgi:hypothetical protein